MTADELYEFVARVGPSSEWEPLYRAEKRRADAAEAKLAEVRRLSRPVVCVECGITWSTHPDFLNHLTAIQRHAEPEWDGTE